jgi:23S rRNA A2030 N6-methylase RlmJ
MSRQIGIRLPLHTVRNRLANFQDIFKLSVLSKTIQRQHNSIGNAAWTYIDLFGGAARYNLDQNGNRQYGIDPIFEYGKNFALESQKHHYTFNHPFVPLMHATRLVNAPDSRQSKHYNTPSSSNNANEALTQLPKLTSEFRYSPGHLPVVAQFLRPQDRAILFEPDASSRRDLSKFVDQYARSFSNNIHNQANVLPLHRRVKILDYELYPLAKNYKENFGYDFDVLGAKAKPNTSHALIYLDCGLQDEWHTIEHSLERISSEILPKITKQFPHAIIICSFPIYGCNYHDDFVRSLVATGVKDVLFARFEAPESFVLSPAEPFQQGLIISKPPEGLEADVEQIIAHMKAAFEGYHGQSSVIAQQEEGEEEGKEGEETEEAEELEQAQEISAEAAEGVEQRDSSEQIKFSELMDEYGVELDQLRDEEPLRVYFSRVYPSFATQITGYSDEQLADLIEWRQRTIERNQQRFSRLAQLLSWPYSEKFDREAEEVSVESIDQLIFSLNITDCQQLRAAVERTQWKEVEEEDDEEDESEGEFDENSKNPQNEREEQEFGDEYLEQLSRGEMARIVAEADAATAADNSVAVADKADWLEELEEFSDEEINDFLAEKWGEFEEKLPQLAAQHGIDMKRLNSLKSQGGTQWVAALTSEKNPNQARFAAELQSSFSESLLAEMGLPVEGVEDVDEAEDGEEEHEEFVRKWFDEDTGEPLSKEELVEDAAEHFDSSLGEQLRPEVALLSRDIFADFEPNFSFNWNMTRIKTDEITAAQEAKAAARAKALHRERASKRGENYYNQTKLSSLVSATLSQQVPVSQIIPDAVPVAATINEQLKPQSVRNFELATQRDPNWPKKFDQLGEMADRRDINVSTAHYQQEAVRNARISQAQNAIASLITEFREQKEQQQQQQSKPTK